MDKAYVWKGVSSVAIAAAVTAGVYFTGNANALWGLLIIAILWLWW